LLNQIHTKNSMYSIISINNNIKNVIIVLVSDTQTKNSRNIIKV